MEAIRSTISGKINSPWEVFCALPNPFNFEFLWRQDVGPMSSNHPNSTKHQRIFFEIFEYLNLIRTGIRTHAYLEDEDGVECPAREREELLDAAGLLPVHESLRGRRQVERGHDVGRVRELRLHLLARDRLDLVHDDLALPLRAHLQGKGRVQLTTQVSIKVSNG